MSRRYRVVKPWLQYREPAYKPALCVDCRADTMRRPRIVNGVRVGGQEYYMVRDDVWSQAMPGYAGFLCIGCLEHRIGRTLTRADFIDAPINTWPAFLFGNSPRLRSRLRNGAA